MTKDVIAERWFTERVIHTIMPKLSKINDLKLSKTSIIIGHIESVIKMPSKERCGQVVL